MTGEMYKEFKEEFNQEPPDGQLQIIRELRDLAITSVGEDVTKVKERLAHIELVLNQLQELK